MGRFRLKHKRPAFHSVEESWQTMFAALCVAHVSDAEGFNWCVELEGVRYVLRLQEMPDGSMVESWRYESDGEWKPGPLWSALDQCGPENVVWLVSPETHCSFGVGAKR